MVPWIAFHPDVSQMLNMVFLKVGCSYNTERVSVVVGRGSKEKVYLEKWIQWKAWRMSPEHETAENIFIFQSLILPDFRSN